MELFCVDIDADSIKLQEPCNKAQKQMLYFIWSNDHRHTWNYVLVSEVKFEGAATHW